ncbi:hypothetical protein LMG27198_30050 [Methylocystis echinoides]|uniref:Uncharacterized protein n=1 Tax=Methylocystis echinoides TaxID=29468 RepID=A0A9W6LSW0_9HYPH|nr:hypothetical protein LMG27198_30050 [Methylocystis echinoides]
MRFRRGGVGLVIRQATSPSSVYKKLMEFRVSHSLTLSVKRRSAAAPAPARKGERLSWRRNT